jgi:protocatechuate 4,5-dioxygenase beta chain
LAKLVEIVGITHAPEFARRLSLNPGTDPDVDLLRDELSRLRVRLETARPDVLIAVGNDHLNQFFMDNMPAFLVGKAPVAQGPWSWESASGIPHYRADVDVTLAKRLIQGSSDNGIDFAYSDEFTLDHAFTFPLAYLSPKADVPIIPIFTNVMAPPIPSAKRFFEVGMAVRKVVQDLPAGLRVGVVCSGHLSAEIGGPRMRGGSPDHEFDEWGMAALGRGDVASLVRELTEPRMRKAGNYTAGFLNFVMLLGMAGGASATQADCMHIGTRNAPILRWAPTERSSGE